MNIKVKLFVSMLYVVASVVVCSSQAMADGIFTAGTDCRQIIFENGQAIEVPCPSGDSVPETPEPATLLMASAGLGAAALFKRRRKLLSV